MHIVEKTFKNFIESINFNHFFIAYSGGVDSQVLLHLSSKYLKGNVTALHVNHGISSNSKKWESFCLETAKKNNVNFEVAHFNLKDNKSNLEEVARKCRHGFFEEKVQEKEVLFTGHHLDDQAETFMLRLMRGSGIDGLSAMQPLRKMQHGGILARPLLEVSKEDITDYAIENCLEWVEDESNASSDYDRNFLRNEVLPLLKTRWNKANQSISRSVKHCQNAQKELERVTEQKYKEVVVDNKIKVKDFKYLTIQEQKSILRSWLKKNNELMLEDKQLDVILKEVIFSRSDSRSCYKNKNYEIRKSFDEIFFLTELKEKDFKPVENCFLGEIKNNLKMQYKGKTKTFKSIMKEEKIPYWERKYYLPSINSDNEVLAFGDILKS